MRSVTAILVALLLVAAAMQLDGARAQGAGPRGLADAG